MIGDRLIRVAHHAFVILLVVGSAIALSAQTVVDPRYVEFTPSADHNTLASDGTPLVQRYSLSVFPVGSSTATATTDLGKPTPSGGIIRVDLLQFLQTIPTGLVFEARVTAVGPGGSTASSVSNGFSFQAACAPTLNSTSQSVGSGATTGSVGVTAGSGCTWSAVSNAGWITLSGATSGNGNGTVPYNVAANASTSARSGTLTVAGQTYTVNQAALSCSYSVSPTSQSVAAGGGTGSTSVTAPSRLRLDGRQQQHVVADGDERGERQRQRHGCLQRLVESEHQLAHRHDHHRRPGVLGDAGRDVLHVRAAAREPVGGGHRRHGLDDGHDIGRLCVDRREQQHVVADGDERRQRQRHGHGRASARRPIPTAHNATAR